MGAQVKRAERLLFGQTLFPMRAVTISMAVCQ